jgi:hypothetical protein
MKSAAAAYGNSRGGMNPGLSGRDRREHRRHDLEQQGIAVERWDGQERKPLGKIVDISAGGVRLRAAAQHQNVRPDQQIRVRLQMPAYAGISPFLAPSPNGLEPKADWVGWMTVSRVKPVDQEQIEVAGRLVDMDEMQRGMFGLYLSTQPLAA